MIELSKNKWLRCWGFMDCPEDIRGECWAYRLNLSRECWILREKACKEFNRRKPEGCINCEFFNYYKSKNQSM